MKDLFRGIFRCRQCGLTHGAYGVQVSAQEVWYPVEENGGREPDRCPRCGAICQHIGGTRIPYTARKVTEENNPPNRLRRGGVIEIHPTTQKKAG